MNVKYYPNDTLKPWEQRAARKFVTTYMNFKEQKYFLRSGDSEYLRELTHELCDILITVEIVL